MAATKELKNTTHAPGWTLSVKGIQVIAQDWKVTSPHGSVTPVVVCDEDGEPVFDRPAYSEAPNVNIVAWGKAENGEVRLAVLHQPRPHADEPGKPGVNGHKPVVFGQVTMGFIEKILGENPGDAASRETREETGAGITLGIAYPKVPWHNPNPTFVSTWSDLVFVEVDLQKIDELKYDRSEPIYKAEYIPVKELLKRIAEGETEDGALYRMCTANSIWMIFFATYPHLWPR